MEAKSETNKPISNFLFILWAGGTALLSYSLVYALRKPFTAATFGLFRNGLQSSHYYHANLRLPHL